MIAQILSILLILEQPQKGHSIHGDNGDAIGPYQIHKEVVVDVNRFYGTKYTWESCAKIKIAKDVCEKYLRMWCGKDRIGREPTVETYLRIWNGGPHGHKRIKATQAYVNRAKEKGLIKEER